VSDKNTTILVAAGVIVREKKLLLSQRKSGTHLAGTWEFPGGKVEPDEDPRDALKRELEEELGVWVHVGAIVETTFHRYDEKSVLLLFYEATLLPDSPEPRPLDVAAVSWVSRRELGGLTFPPADVAIVEKVKRLL
jgi:8-oxo-dGTP diphosphatase